MHFHSTQTLSLIQLLNTICSECPILANMALQPADVHGKEHAATQTQIVLQPIQLNSWHIYPVSPIAVAKSPFW
jgi:hypothetical protein